jgi:hypothetical protein
MFFIAFPPPIQWRCEAAMLDFLQAAAGKFRAPGKCAGA